MTAFKDAFVNAAQFKKNNDNANQLNEQANKTASQARECAENARIACQNTLEELGKKKIETFEVYLKDWHEVFKQIHDNTRLRDSVRLESSNLSADDRNFLVEIEDKIAFAAEASKGLAGGAALGGVAAYGAYSGAMAFGATSAGTAISSLSGAAATNATLAWLGGGSLAAGGGGMAAGMVALGGIVVAPAALAAGLYMGAKAKTRLNAAKNNLAKAEAYAADMRTLTQFSEDIARVAKLAIELLSKLCVYLRDCTEKLKKIVQRKGQNGLKYNRYERNKIERSVALAQMTQAVLETPILDAHGNLMGDSEANLLYLKEEISDKFSRRSVLDTVKAWFCAWFARRFAFLKVDKNGAIFYNAGALAATTATKRNKSQHNAKKEEK